MLLLCCLNQAKSKSQKSLLIRIHQTLLHKFHLNIQSANVEINFRHHSEIGTFQAEPSNWMFYSQLSLSLLKTILTEVKGLLIRAYHLEEHGNARDLIIAVLLPQQLLYIYFSFKSRARRKTNKYRQCAQYFFPSAEGEATEKSCLSRTTCVGFSSLLQHDQSKEVYGEGGPSKAQVKQLQGFL